MYSGISYGEYLDISQCRVSVDNVRLKFSYKYKNYDFEKQESVETVELLCAKLNNLYFDNCEVVWKCCDFFKIGNYARTCKLSGKDSLHGEWSCAVMVGRYAASCSCKRIASEAVFDFNPNKVPYERYMQIIGLLRNGCKSTTVSRFDVAFDFPIPRDHVTLIPNDRQCYRLFRDAQKGVTEYQGERSHHNAMKLYDKTKESKLLVPVTRCEITIGGDYEKSVETLFPTLIVLRDLQLDVGFSELPFPVVACLFHPDMIPELKKRTAPNTWRKYKEMIVAHSQRKLTPDNWSGVDQYLSAWFTQLLGGVV